MFRRRVTPLRQDCRCLLTCLLLVATQAPVGTPAKPAKSKKQWKIVRAAKIRSGFEQTSTDMGVANVGDIIDEIESRVNARGVTRTPRTTLEPIRLTHSLSTHDCRACEQVCTMTADG